MSKDINGLIYCATNIVNGKQYVGQTHYGIERRKGEHKRHSKRVDNKFYRAIRKHGWDSFIWYTLEENISTIEELNDKEEFWIGLLDAFYLGYNSTTGGGNFIMSDISREKLSKAKKGKPLSEEHKKSISTANKGRVATLEARQNMSKAQRGRTLSEEHKRKLSEAHKGLFVAGKPVLQLDKITGEVIAEFISGAEAMQITGISKSTICMCCKGVQKTASGYIWRYKEN